MISAGRAVFVSNIDVARNVLKILALGVAPYCDARLNVDIVAKVL